MNSLSIKDLGLYTIILATNQAGRLKWVSFGSRGLEQSVAKGVRSRISEWGTNSIGDECNMEDEGYLEYLPAKRV